MAEIVAQIVAEGFCAVTGEIVLWLVTFGRQKPFESNDTFSTLVGLAFWAAVVFGIWFLFFR